MTRDEHYVPKMYLKRFCETEQTIENIHVDDYKCASRMCVKKANIGDICKSRDLYELTDVNGYFCRQNGLENIFSRYESQMSQQLDGWGKHWVESNPKRINKAEKEKIAEFLLLMLFRNPKIIGAAQSIISDSMWIHGKYATEELKKVYWFVKSFWGDPKEKTESLLVKETKNLQEKFKIKVFLAASSEKSFWTADVPVATVAIEKKRILYMPLSSSCAVQFANDECGADDCEVEWCNEDDVAHLNKYMLNCRTDLLLSKHFEDTDIAQIESYLRKKNQRVGG